MEESLRDYFNSIRKIPLLTREEEVEIAKKIEEGNESARSELVKHNLRFVVGIAKKYKSQELSLQDLIEEGNIGLIIASQKFDYHRGYRFISYAKWWIRRNIQLSLYNSKAIRVSVGMNEKIRWKKKLEGEGFSDDKIKEMLNLSEERLEEITSLPNTISIYSPVNGNEEKTIEGKVADMRYSPESVAHVERDNLILFLEKTVGKRRAEILKLRFGFVDGVEYNFSEIGKKYSISRQRVRELYDLSIAKLRKEMEKTEEKI